MMSLDQQFNSIHDKIQLLLKQMGRLQKENEKLKEQLQETALKESNALQQADELRQQLAILKYAAGNMSEQEKKDFEKKINQFIREIDKCIAYLSQ